MTGIRAFIFFLFTLPGAAAIAQCPAEEYADAFQTYELDVQPEFPDGGDAAFMHFLSRISFPVLDSTAAEPLYDLRIQFVVEADGRINRVCALKHTDHPWTLALMRHVAILPTWKPGQKNGQPVPTLFILPVRMSPG